MMVTGKGNLRKRSRHYFCDGGITDHGNECWPITERSNDLWDRSRPAECPQLSMIRGSQIDLKFDRGIQHKSGGGRIEKLALIPANPGPG